MSNQQEPTSTRSGADRPTYLGVSQLLNSIARDLDHMLLELGQSPTATPSPLVPPDEPSAGSHYRRATFQPSAQCHRRNSGDALLEQFMQSLLDSLALPGTPADGRAPVVPSSPLCILGINGGGQEPSEAPPSEDNGEASVDPPAQVTIEGSSSAEQPCDINLVERIIRTHPVWYLPGITRAGAVHLLQGKEAGNFIVRKSSKVNTMAISVRLPDDTGPYIEHYLIESVGRGFRLEGSDNHFDAIPTLVAHYCQCCDELPVKLSLPRAIESASTRQELSSLAMLGQDFWVSSIAKIGSPSKSAGSSSGSNTMTLTSFSQKLPAGHAIPRPIPVPGPSSSLSVSGSSPESPSSALSLRSTNPPPPPPRWSKPQATVSTTTNFTVTTTVTFNVNQNMSIPMDTDTEQNDILAIQEAQDSVALPRPKVLLDSNSVKTSKRDKKATHYTQSNIIDSPAVYYRSSLADKISDYEDIWGTPSRQDLTKQDSKPELVTFKPQVGSARTLQSPDSQADKKPEDPNQTDHEKVLAKENCSTSNGFSTDTSESKSSKSSSATSTLQSQPAKMRNKFGLTVETEMASKTENKKHSSPFYAEPIDSLIANNKFQKPFVLLKGTKKVNKREPIPSGPPPPRLLNHRHSDPNIHWPMNQRGGILETIYAAEDSQTSLSSSLDNLNGRGRLIGIDQKKSSGFVNVGYGSQSSNLNRTFSREKLVIRENQATPESAAEIGTDSKGSSLKRSLHSLKPPIIPRIGGKSFNDSSWPVDSSWEWLGNDNESFLDDSDLEDENLIEGIQKRDAKFPIEEFPKETSIDSSMQFSDRTTVEDLIQQKSPDLRVPEIQSLTRSNLLRVSEYDNLDEDLSSVTRENYGYEPSDTASSGTEFCEPWDSSRWEKMLRHCNQAASFKEEGTREWKENNLNASIESGNNKDRHHVELLPLDLVNEAVMSKTRNLPLIDNDGTSVSSFPSADFDEESAYKIQPPSMPSTNLFLLRSKNKNLGKNIREYVLRLSQDRNTTFGKTIENFLQCTLDSHETSPHIAMRNVRQFMSGIKNYLVKHGEGQFETLVQEERSKLKANEFLNLDAILEGVLHKIVIKPLKKHIYQLFVNEYNKNGSLRELSDNIKYARTKTPEEFNIKPELNPPHGAAMDTVHHYLRKLQQVYSPMKKLENLLAATSAIFTSVHSDKHKEEVCLGADDFLPMLMYVLVHCGMIAAEIEADYMWGLLHPSLLTGEGGYYLTTLSSAVHVLKNFQKCQEGKQNRGYNSIETKEALMPCLSEMQGFMKIMIPDEVNGSIISKTFPVRPNMNTKEVGKMIAHKFNITNPQDYGLFKLMNGEELLLQDTECPYALKADAQAEDIECLFAYKRVDAKIAWPITSKKT